MDEIKKPFSVVLEDELIWSLDEDSASSFCFSKSETFSSRDEPTNGPTMFTDVESFATNYKTNNK